MKPLAVRLTAWTALVLLAVVLGATDVIPAVSAGLDDAASLCAPPAAAAPAVQERARLRMFHCGVA